MNFPHRKNFVLFFAAVLTLLFIAPAHAQENKEPTFYWKFATLAPKGSGWAKHIEQMVIPVIGEATAGDVAIKTYYGGIMGDDEDVLAKMNKGILQGAGLSAQGATMACKQLSVLMLPFLFQDYGEVDFLKGKMFNTFNSLMQENGYFLLAWIDQDFDQVYSTILPMNTLEQFHKSKFLTWYGPVEQNLLQVLGARMVPVDVPDATEALIRAKANAGIAPGLWVVGAQMYSVIKYINPMKIRYSPATIMTSTKAWGTIPKDYRQKFFALRDELMQRYCLAVRADNEKALEAMYQYGLKKVETQPREMKRIKKTTRQVWKNLAGQLYPQSLLDEIEAHLAEYRSQKEK